MIGIEPRRIVAPYDSRFWMATSMAKLTLSFNDRVVAEYELDREQMTRSEG